MFAQDAFVQVRLKELNLIKYKPSVKDGFIFCPYNRLRTVVILHCPFFHPFYALYDL